MFLWSACNFEKDCQLDYWKVSPEMKIASQAQNSVPAAEMAWMFAYQQPMPDNLSLHQTGSQPAEAVAAVKHYI